MTTDPFISTTSGLQPNTNLLGTPGAIVATSLTQQTIGLGVFTFKVQPQAAFAPGMWISITNPTNANQWMWAVVKTYTGTQLTVQTTQTFGQGTISDWNISLSGPPFLNGAIGNNQLAPVPAHTIKSNISASSNLPTDNTLTSVIDNDIDNTDGHMLQRVAGLWSGVAPSAFAVTSFTGDGVVLSNSASPGAVTATLETVAAHTVLIGPASSTATPTFRTLTLADLPAGLGVAGSDTQVQFNDAGSFGANSGLTYNYGTNTLTATNYNTSAPYQITGTNVFFYDAATNDLYAGAGALGAGLNGLGNIAFGTNALHNLSAGSFNIAIGTGALTTFTSGAANIAIGHNSLTLATTCTDNISIGYLAGEAITTGSNNIAIGSAALAFCNTASNNVAIGGSALNDCTTGADNVAIGIGAGANISTGSNNTAIGINVGTSTTTGSYNIAIGGSSAVGASAGGVSNNLNIGLAFDGTTGENSNTTNAGLRTLGYMAEGRYFYTSSGTSHTLENRNSTAILDLGAGVTYSLTAPPTPVDGQLLAICVGTNSVTVNFLANGGQTVINGGTMTVTTGVGFIYSQGTGTWYRKY